jgi:hypothetical protein
MPVKKPVKGQSRKKTSKAEPQNGRAPSFESPCFWLSMAAIDFSKIFMETNNNCKGREI